MVEIVLRNFQIFICLRHVKHEFVDDKRSFANN